VEIDRPTAADYANANADAARRAAEGNAEKRAELEERVILLEGQVSFLAGIVWNMNKSLARPAPEDMDMLDRICKLPRQ
jgi:hypothetical protein